MRLHVVLATGAVGLAIAALWLTIARRSPEPVRPAAMAAEDPVAVLQREVAALKQQVARQAVAPAPVAAPRVDAAANAPAVTDPRVKRPPEGYRPAEIAEMLESHYAGELTDPAWSDKLQGDLKAALADHGGTTVSSTQCTTSLCKVGVVHETAAAQRELASRVVALPAFAAGVFFRYEDGAEPPRTVLYVMRKGHDIREAMAAR